MKEDSDVDGNLLLLLVAAGVAQQSQGYLLENELNQNNSFDKLHVVISFTSAVMLQSGEFAVVYDVIPNKDGWDNLAYANYVLGYSYFGIIMFWCLQINDTKNKEKFEKVYSIAGLIAKLSILFSDVLIFKRDTLDKWDVSMVLVTVFTALPLVIAPIYFLIKMF